MSYNRKSVENTNTFNKMKREFQNHDEDDFNFSSFLDCVENKNLENKIAKSAIIKKKQNLTNLKMSENFDQNFWEKIKEKNKNMENENFDKNSISMKSAWNQNKNNKYKTIKNQNYEKIKKNSNNFLTRKFNNKNKSSNKKIIKKNLERDDLINYLEKDLKILEENKYDLNNCITWKKNDILINCRKFTNEINKTFRFLEDYPDLFIPKLKKLLQKLFPSKFIPKKKNLFKKIKKTSKEKSKINEIKNKNNFSIETKSKKIIDHYNKIEIRLYYWNYLTKNDILNRDIDQFLKIEGFIIYISPQKVLVTSMKFKCSQCGLNIFIQFKKFIIKYPEKCESCLNTQFFPLKTTSKVLLMQRVKIQQFGEEQKIAMLELKGDLVNSVDIGDEIICNGILRSEILNKDDFLGKQQNKTGGLFMYFIEVNSLLKKKEKILQNDLQNNQNFEVLDESNILTSQIMFNNNNNLFSSSYKKALYFLEIPNSELEIFKQIVEEELVFETLITFFCPKVKSCYLLKSFIILSLILQEDPIHLLIIGNPGSNKTELLNFANENAHKNIPNLSLNLFPTLEKISGFEKSINPGILALGNEGICVFDHIDKLKKKDIDKFSFLMEDKKVSVPKLYEKTFLEANTTILGGVECFQEINNNFEDIKNNLKLPKKVVDNFDFILIAKKKQKKYIKNLTTKLFKRTQKLTQINQEDIKKKGFSIYIKNKIEEHEIKKRFIILSDNKIYKKFQMYIQNLYKPILTPEIGEYIKEYYFELKEKFNLKNGEISPKFFLSIIKLIFARTILNCKSTINLQICDEVIEMLNENFQNLYPYNNENFKCNINTNGKANKDLSKTKKEKIFIEKLREVAKKDGRSLYLFRELKEFEEFLDLQIEDFDNFIYKLNHIGFLLKKNAKEYQIRG